ncbi:MAG: PHB depolymerase family esterase [Bacteroidota bacterium]
MKIHYSIILSLFTVASTVSLAQTNGSIQHNGITRNYIVYVPAAYQPGDSWPLVFVLHGFTQTASAIMGVSGFNAIADTGNFIVAYPNGVGNAWNTNSGMTGGSTADDIGFVAALTDTLYALYNIDTNRVFSCGFSAGGYMSHRLACESPRCYAAVASVSGTMSVNAFNACAPARDISVMQIHGTSDAIVSYNGSAQGGKSVADVIGLWVGQNSCSTSPQVQLLPDINTQDNSTVEKSVYAPCGTGTEVNLYKVIGGGHQWPGTTSLLGGLGAVNRDISASAEIWNFFSRFSCPIPSSLPEMNGPANDFVLEQDHTNGTITVSHLGNGYFQISMYDLSGKLLFQESALESLTISRGSNPQGVYLLKGVAAKTTATFKIIFD